MKTNYLIIVILLCAVFNLNAQDKNTSNAGIKFGYNLAAITYDGDTETGQRHGFHAGIYGESFLNDATALQIEFLCF